MYFAISRENLCWIKRARKKRFFLFIFLFFNWLRASRKAQKNWIELIRITARIAWNAWIDTSTLMIVLVLCISSFRQLIYHLCVASIGPRLSNDIECTVHRLFCCIAYSHYRILTTSNHIGESVNAAKLSIHRMMQTFSYHFSASSCNIVALFFCPENVYLSLKLDFLTLTL